MLTLFLEMFRYNWSMNCYKINSSRSIMILIGQKESVYARRYVIRIIVIVHVTI